MMKRFFLLIAVLALGMLAACNGSNDDDMFDESGEPKELKVQFDLPEAADVGETVDLKATVTYGEDLVTDGEVEFEYWEKNDEDNSSRIEGENNDDGTYTAEVSFDHDGIFELYAHTDAKDLHTMPLESITIGE